MDSVRLFLVFLLLLFVVVVVIIFFNFFLIFFFWGGVDFRSYADWFAARDSSYFKTFDALLMADWIAGLVCFH